MQADGIEALGLVAGAIGALAYLPQAVKIIRDRSAHDVSALTYTMVLAGNVLWLVYGCWRDAISIVLWNFVAGAIAATVLTLKVTSKQNP